MKYWEKRPTFEAVKLIPENKAKIREMTENDVAFSEENCYFHLYGHNLDVPIGCWLVQKEFGNLVVYEDTIFKKHYEPVIENTLPFEDVTDVLDEVVNDITDAEVIAELIEAIRFTVEYVGTAMLPPIEGWSWYDALSKYSPATAEALKAKSRGSES